MQGLPCQTPNKKGRLISQPAFSVLQPFGLELYHVCGLGALGPADDFKAHRLTFSQRLETIVLNVGVVDKYISTIFLADEPEALGLVEPLNSSFCHGNM